MKDTVLRLFYKRTLLRHKGFRDFALQNNSIQRVIPRCWKLTHVKIFTPLMCSLQATAGQLGLVLSVVMYSSHISSGIYPISNYCYSLHSWLNKSNELTALQIDVTPRDVQLQHSVVAANHCDHLHRAVWTIILGPHSCHNKDQTQNNESKLIDGHRALPRSKSY